MKYNGDVMLALCFVILTLINTALTAIKGAKMTGFLLTIEYISLVGEKDISSLLGLFQQMSLARKR